MCSKWVCGLAETQLLSKSSTACQSRDGAEDEAFFLCFSPKHLKDGVFGKSHRLQECFMLSATGF